MHSSLPVIGQNVEVIRPVAVARGSVDFANALINAAKRPKRDGAVRPAKGRLFVGPEIVYIDARDAAIDVYDGTERGYFPVHDRERNSRCQKLKLPAQSAVSDELHCK